MFEPNEKVVYPGHGVANVDGVIEKTVSGSSVKFIKLTFLYKDMTVLIPIYNADSLGLRYISSIDIVDAAIEELKRVPEKKLECLDFTPSGWNRRHREYQLKIQGGKLIDIVKVYRDLMHIAQQKELSFGERMLLQSIEELLSQEIQSVKAISNDDAIQELRSPFKKLLNITPYSKLNIKKGVQVAST